MEGAALMDFIQLQYFLAAAEEEHFTKAASRLNITQPTLSICISRLEKELGCTLFERSGRQVRLNRNGKILFQHTRKILKEYDTCIAELTSLARQDLSELAFASMTLHIHNYFVRNFLKKHPDFSISQQILLADQIHSVLQDPEIDFCFVNVYLEDEDAEYLLLSQDPMMLAVAKNNPLSKMKTYRLEDLVNERFVVNPRGTGFVSLFNELFASKGLPIPKTLNVLPSEWQGYLEEGYLGLGTEQYFDSGAFDSRIRFIPPEDEKYCKRSLYLMWNKTWPLSKAAELFLKETRELINTADEMIPFGNI